MITIYYIEDDPGISHLVRDDLARRGCAVSVFSAADEARRAFKNALPSLALVDWNMPGESGRSLCQWIRENWRELPVIFLTVRGDARDIVSGFRCGADDYLVKPFDLDVLYSHILAVLRRTGDASRDYLTCGPISIDCKRTAAFLGTEELALSPSEYQLLLYLMQHKGRTVTRDKLLAHIWDDHGNYVNDNTLTVTVKRLREKLRRPDCLKTVRSIGYRMEDPL